MKAPHWWHGAGSGSGISTALLPVAYLYGLAGRMRRRWAKPFHAKVPVICVGNIVAGGAGKTPVALALAQQLQAMGQTPHCISRGYGGTAQRVPLRVDPAQHKAAETGDEPLLLAKAVPTWVCADRREAAKAAVSAGASCLIMDDGLQNPHLYQDIRLMVVDAQYGLGNGWVIPAGPLRETLADALTHVDAVVVNGAAFGDVAAVAQRIFDGKLPASLPIFTGALEPRIALTAYRERPVIAFAGIGRPQKFFDMLTSAELTLVESIAFADHYSYHAADEQRLRQLQAEHNAVLMTTEKDAVKLSADMQAELVVVPVSFEWAEPERMAAWLKARLS